MQVEIQVFAELWRPFEEQIKVSGANSLVVERVSSFLHSRKIHPRSGYKLQGKVETEVVVDFLVPNESLLAVEVVKRARHLRPYME